MSKSHPISGYLSYSLAAAHRNIHLSLGRQLKNLGVQIETWRILETLNGDQGHTMGQLADIVLMNPPALTKLVDRMVADGLVQRRISVEDQRSIQLILTDIGLVMVEKIRRHVEDEDRQMLERLGPRKAKQLQQALEILQ
ncbi:MAG: MarR family transcriptional regulator [Pseudomonadota bacterium]